MAESDFSVNVRLLVPTRLSGGLIGKGGAIIKQFREDSGASLDIASPVPYAQNRVLTAKGQKENVVSGLVMISNRLGELSGKDAENATPGVNVVFIIANSKVGCILGRAGAVIKSIREDSGANLKMSDQPLPGSTDKTLTVKGDSTQVEFAIERIVEQLAGYTGRTNSQYPEIPYVPKPMGMPITGPPYGGPAVGTAGGRPGAPGSAYFPAGASSYGAASPYSPYGAYAPPELKLTWLIPVEEHHVGTVIGKGGCNIQDIRVRSGAQVKMEAKSEEGKEGGRVVTITGTRSQNEVAMHLVFKKIASYDPDYKGSRRRNRNGETDGQPAPIQ